MQCVAQCCTVCCSVLQCVVVCCSVLQLSIQLPFEKNWRLCVVAQDAALIPMKFLKKLCIEQCCALSLFEKLRWNPIYCVDFDVNSQKTQWTLIFDYRSDF